MKSNLILVLLLFFGACNDARDRDSSEESYKQEVSKTLDREQIQEAEDRKRYLEMGEVKPARIDKNTKCNLTKGYFLLSREQTDSSDLDFMAKYLANELYKSGLANSDPGCSYPVMSAAYVYKNEEEYKSGQENWVSMCTITPSNPTGYTSVAMDRINKK